MAKQRVQVLLETEIIEALKKEAEAEGRNLSGQIRYKLMKYEELERQCKQAEAVNTGAFRP